MKFLLTWTNSPETRHKAYKAFSEMSDEDDAADHPGVTLIGRWHDLVAGEGALICESDDLSAVQAWAFNWNDVIDVAIRPVVDDQEAKSMLREKLDLDEPA